MDAADKAVSKADIVIFAAPAQKRRFFPGKRFSQVLIINGVGSYLPHMQEVVEETLLRCSKVADTIEDVKDEAGDFIIPANAGIWSFNDLYLTTGQITGRENDKEITFFKSIGIAYFDMAVAAAVYENAIRAGQVLQWNYKRQVLIQTNPLELLNSLQNHREHPCKSGDAHYLQK
jgi:ornithine cyclodeaminase/alanine dehydrogenase-like protein (mu-crystallin family)